MKVLIFHYGLRDYAHARELAQKVCDVLGHGENGVAAALLLETAAAETGLGTFQDRTESNGFGLCQVDRIGVEDVQARTKERDIQAIRKAFGYDIKTIKPKDLNNDPLLSLIFCRLHYKLRPEIIPKSFAGRATYWKWFYNTKAGKGTPEHYMKSAEHHLYRTTKE